LLRTPIEPLQIVHFVMHREIKIPLPLCQATAFHQSDIFILIILLWKGYLGTCQQSDTLAPPSQNAVCPTPTFFCSPV
jgi:hypothetical protein